MDGARSAVRIFETGSGRCLFETDADGEVAYVILHHPVRVNVPTRPTINNENEEALPFIATPNFLVGCAQCAVAGAGPTEFHQFH